MSYNVKIMEADRRNVSPYDIDAKIKAEVEQIIHTLRIDVK